jgi:succinoglycan biosynthesis protein ExoO
MDNSQYKCSPTVSVVMPVYNGALTLREAVDSILTQTFRDFELIICNDASTDETRSVLKNITDERVKVIHNDINLGPGSSRDRAIEIARGTWLAFTDADDSWVAERLDNLLRATGSTEKVMVFDDIMTCHDVSSGMIPWRNIRGKNAFSGDNFDIIDVPLDQFICSKRLLIKPLLPTAFVRDNRIRHRQRPDSREPVEDTDFFLQLMARGMRLRYIPKPMYLYRITPGSATSQTKRKTMMRKVLEDMMLKFEHAPSVQAALKKKMAKVAQDEQYMPFVWTLNNKQFHKALRLACRSPWVIPEFFRRLGHSIAYHLHRIWYGGRTRGIR